MGSNDLPSPAAAAVARAGRSLPVPVELAAELAALYADCAAALDERRYADWIDLFTDDCVYRVQARENYDRDLPLAQMDFESKGMLRDRVYGIEQTLFHAPYYQRHVLGVPRVVGRDGDTLFVQSNYAVFRTRFGGFSEVFNVGRTVDVVVRDAGLLRFASRIVVFDSELIPNSIIYPL